MKRTFIAAFIGMLLGAGLTTLIVRQTNSEFLIRPALVSANPEDRESEYLLKGPGWHVPFKILPLESELRLVFPGSVPPKPEFAVNLYVNPDGVHSVTVVNSDRHGVTVSKSKNGPGLFDELKVHTPSTDGDGTLVKVDGNLDGVFEKELPVKK